MIEKLEEYKEKIENWAEERGIYDVPDHYKQLLKLGEEFSELLVAINKKDTQEMKDAIGDMFVCIVNVGKILNINILDLVIEEPNKKYEINSVSIYAVNALMCTDNKNALNLKLLVNILQGFCNHLKIDFLECVDLAWNTIKNRKGRMVNGKFVREE